MKKSLPVLMLLVALVAGSFYSCENGGTQSGSVYNEKSKPATEFNNSMAIIWGDLLLDQIRFQRVGPPPAARAMGYLGAAMYESVVHGIPDGHSLAGQLKGLDKLPVPDAGMEYDWPTVLNNCAYLVCDEGLSRYMGPNTVALVQLRDKMNHQCDSIVANADVSARSKQYGQDLANAFIDYMKTDQYDYTRENNIYESPSRAGDPAHPELWEPTDIDKTAFEPYFGGLRPLGLDTTQLCMMEPTIPYSSDSSSEFCKFCEKLYGIDTSFSEYDRITSLYWADCPVETYTPPGHWMKITKQQVRKNGYNLAQTCELYAYLGMAEYNAAISVWKIKYKVNLLRPKTYIAEMLKKPDWEPYLETPPFPEYPSGHSGFSGAASTVLTKYFGDNVEFTDSTNLVIGLYPRKFKSFNAAANEAAYSRMYGGIHYEAAILDGITVGSCVANNLLKSVTLGSGGAAVAKK
ncbi:MAG: vanadium-dependent haloperoxidase [Chitinophagaceae bacterium]|nr:vanadium-dependent haloperoxidase [Chitinophagaceae bacterium]